MKKHPKADKALQDVLTALSEDRITVKDIARGMIERRAGHKPSDGWSLLNRLIMHMSGTEDARTFKVWQKLGRYPRKGSKAFYILRPVKYKRKDTDADGNETERWFLGGFTGQPEFRLEDTYHPADVKNEDGSITYYVTERKGAKPRPLSDLVPDYKPEAAPPLSDVAGAWRIPITYAPSNGWYWGAYSPDADAIQLRTHDTETFFHELAHAAHARILIQDGRKLKAGQHWDQEAAAEFAS